MTLSDCKKTKIFLYKGDNKEVLSKDLNFNPNIVYLDPPYNTWNSTLTYGDKESSNVWYEEFKDLLQKINRICKKNSVIFISINDEELANVIISSREVFGLNSIISISPRRTHSGHKTSKTISNQHDFIVMVKKGNITFNGIEIDTDSYKEVDDFFEERGKHQLRRIDYKDFKWSESLDQPYIINGIKYFPGGVDQSKWIKRKTEHNNKDWAWIWSKEKMDFAFKNSFAIVKDGKLYKKTYTKSEIVKEGPGKYSIVNHQRTKKYDSLHFTSKEYALKKTKTNPEMLFDYPKSDELIRTLISIPNFKEKIILDPFGGTGTTAIAAKNISAKEVHIIQLAEETKKDSQASKAGYKNIYELTKANIEERTNEKVIEYER